ncbi:hypothetical protein BC941DRAFT_512170 [Chlamydoabsidia padenii]|nr:hypothetical protein BC941DRAFT_512170 [Chlamydoabsidia padenii]
MTTINDNVHNSIPHTTEDSSANDKTSNVESSHTESSQSQELPAVASAAAGMPAPHHVVNAMKENNNKQQEQEQKQDTSGSGSTAIGIPNPSAVDNAVQDAGEKQRQVKQDSVPSSTGSSSDTAKENENKETTTKDKRKHRKGSKRESLKKAVDTVAHAPATAAHKVIKKVAPSKASGSSTSSGSNSSGSDSDSDFDSDLQQQQQSEPNGDKQVGEPQQKDTAVMPKEAVHAAIASTADNGAIDVTACLPVSSECSQSVDGSQPVVEQLAAPVQTEPEMETALVEKPSLCPTSADVKTTPDLEALAISEEPAPADQRSTGQQLKTEQASPLALTESPASTTQNALMPNTVTREHTAEKPVTAHDIKTSGNSTTVEPIKNEGAVDQISMPVSDNDVKTGSVQQQLPSEEIKTASKGQEHTSDKLDDQLAPNPAPSSTSIGDNKMDDQLAPTHNNTSMGDNKVDGQLAPTSAPNASTGDNKVNDQSVATTVNNNKVEDKSARVPQQPSTQAPSEHKSRGINSTEHHPSAAAAESKALPQPSSGLDQAPKDTTGSKNPSCTLM